MKKMFKIFLILFALFSTLGGNTLIAQINVGVSGTPSVVNAYYPVTAISGTTVTRGTGTGVSHTLAVNDRVLLIQMTGNTSANGGKFEFAKVTAVSGTSITLDAITRNYTPTTEKVQLVWVPYDPVGITIIANILARDWNGSTGGIVALLTQGTLTMNGAVLADGAGFRYSDGANTIKGADIYYGGGSAGMARCQGGGGGGYGSPGNGSASCPGMGNSGVSGSYNGAPYSGFSEYQGQAGGGGGGGVGAGGGGSGGGTYSAGGGGGAGISAGGCGGQGAGCPNTCGLGGLGSVYGVGDTNGQDAPNPGGLDNRGGGGGGGGSYVGGEGGDSHSYASGKGGFCGSNGGGNNTLGGDGGGTVPSSYHIYQTCDGNLNCPDPRIWMGGGGGSGPSSAFGQSYAYGGGIVLLHANTIVSNNQTISASGDDGDLPFTPTGEGYIPNPAGGGGGGIIVLNANSITNGTLHLSAKGGDGRKAYEAAWITTTGGSSGGGGAGVIWVNDPTGAIGNNFTSAPPIVNNLSFDVSGGIPGDAVWNPKSSTFSTSGGCGGSGLVSVNPNCSIFEETCLISCSLSDAGKTNEACTNNGTASNPADDYITFSLNPTGTGLGSGYTITASGGATVTPTLGTYGSATNFQLQNGSANGTTYTITVTDNATGACQTTTTVMQNSCSNACSLTGADKTNEACNNNGTGSDPADDYITFSLNPTGSGLGSGYTVTASGGATVTQATGTYGSATSFRLQNGSANGTTYTITVTDNATGSCTITTIVQQNSCSNACTLTGAGKSSEVCNSNNTPAITTDDYITFSLNPTGSNLGTGYTVTASGGGTVTPSSGTYGSATNFQLQNGSANGTTYTITVTDNATGSCQVTTTVMKTSCSTCPTADCLQWQVRKN